ncbi:MAG: hypothetical protein Ta2E_11440 [Mycoplasmoidaceae bacterium]|nr:MAG: hypothetical protein Ta2E_11440 [Mycoplasmoidaceae bacterium]
MENIKKRAKAFKNINTGESIKEAVNTFNQNIFKIEEQIQSHESNMGIILINLNENLIRITKEAKLIIDQSNLQNKELIRENIKLNDDLIKAQTEQKMDIINEINNFLENFIKILNKETVKLSTQNSEANDRHETHINRMHMEVVKTPVSDDQNHSQNFWNPVCKIWQVYI